MTRKHTNSRMQKKPNNFGKKIWQPKKDNRKAERINNMTKELEGIEEGPKAEIHIDLLKMTLKNQTGKRQAMMECMVSSSRNTPPFTTD